MKLTPYEKVLKFGKEKVQEMLAGPRSAEMRSKAANEIATLDVKIAEKENSIASITSEYPLDFNKLIAAQDEHALLGRRKSQLEKIVKELFPA